MFILQEFLLIIPDPLLLVFSKDSRKEIKSRGKRNTTRIHGSDKFRLLKWFLQVKEEEVFKKGKYSDLVTLNNFK